jgi:hypothetical protein
MFEFLRISNNRLQGGCLIDGRTLKVNKEVRRKRWVLVASQEPFMGGWRMPRVRGAMKGVA